MAPLPGRSVMQADTYRPWPTAGRRWSGRSISRSSSPSEHEGPTPLVWWPCRCPRACPRRAGVGKTHVRRPQSSGWSWRRPGRANLGLLLPGSPRESGVHQTGSSTRIVMTRGSASTSPSCSDRGPFTTLSSPMPTPHTPTVSSSPPPSREPARHLRRVSSRHRQRLPRGCGPRVGGTSSK